MTDAAEFEVCHGCGNQIDPDVCWCGDEIKEHNPYRAGHNPVPMGCTCGYQKALADNAAPDKPEPLIESERDEPPCVPI